MLADLSRAVRLILVRHFWPISLACLMAGVFGSMALTVRWSDAAIDGPLLGARPSEVLVPVALLVSLGGWAALWTWLLRRLEPGLDADFDGARSRLGGVALSDRTRMRLRAELDRVLPRPGQVGSVLRAFRARVGGADVIVAEWSPNGPMDSLVLAEAELVVVLPDCATALPAFHLEPESFVTRCGEWLHRRVAPAASRRASEDVDFKRDPEWSDKWFLCGPRRAALRSLFRRRVRDVFRRVSGWRASGRGRWLVLRTHRAVASQNLAAKVSEAAGLVARFQRAAAV